MQDPDLLRELGHVSGGVDFKDDDNEALSAGGRGRTEGGRGGARGGRGIHQDDDDDDDDDVLPDQMGEGDDGDANYDGELDLEMEEALANDTEVSGTALCCTPEQEIGDRRCRDVVFKGCVLKA